MPPPPPQPTLAPVQNSAESAERKNHFEYKISIFNVRSSLPRNPFPERKRINGPIHHTSARHSPPTSRMYQSYPVFCIPSRNTRSAIIRKVTLSGKILDRGANTSERSSTISNGINYEPTPGRAFLSLSLSPFPPPLSLISLLQSPTSLSTRPLLPFPPDQNRPLPSSAASSRFSTSFAPQGRKSESEIITVGSADII